VRSSATAGPLTREVLCAAPIPGELSGSATPRIMASLATAHPCLSAPRAAARRPHGTRSAPASQDFVPVACEHHAARRRDTGCHQVRQRPDAPARV